MKRSMAQRKIRKKASPASLTPSAEQISVYIMTVLKGLDSLALKVFRLNP